MVFNYQVSTKIVINAPPAFVKQTFLDFDNLPTWASAFVSNIKVTKSVDGSSGSLGAGTKLSVTTSSMTFGAEVVRNTQEEFVWRGGFPFIVAEIHTFVFRANDAGGKTTELVQMEALNGLAVPLLSFTGIGGKMERDFNALNEELKARCETTYRA